MVIRDDCLNALKKMEGESIDMAYLDPPFFTQKEKPLQQAVAAPCRGNPSKKFNLIRLRQAFKDSQVGQDFYSGIADLGPVPQVFP